MQGGRRACELGFFGSSISRGGLGTCATTCLEFSRGFAIRSDAGVKRSDANNLRTQTQSEVMTIRSPAPRDNATCRK